MGSGVSDRRRAAQRARARPTGASRYQQTATSRAAPDPRLVTQRPHERWSTNELIHELTGIPQSETEMALFDLCMLGAVRIDGEGAWLSASVRRLDTLDMICI